MRKPLYIICLLILQNTVGQNPYPQDYFNSPLDVPLILAGTFAELRSNHFHSGLDIKTQQREGLKVYASAHGYVSRIKISTYGYGKALYITHPNGYTTVYAHLQKFSKKIEDYVKKQQYINESYDIELFPKIEDLLIESHEIIAFSGNTGGSAGPHLHYEIRDKQERPINPMLFGIDLKDSRSPRVLNVFAYPISDSAHVNASKVRQELRLTKNKTGDYTTEHLNAYGKIGFGIVTYDQLDGAHNKNGVSNIQSFNNGTKKLEIDFKRFSFSETKHLNRLIDYEYFKSKKARIQKLFIEPNNPLSIYKDHVENGYLTIDDNTSSVFKIKINDYKNNAVWVTININGKKNNSIKPRDIKKTAHFVYADQAATLEQNNVSVHFSKNTFYDDLYLDFEVINDSLKLGKDEVPLQKNMVINFDISNYKEEDKNQLYIGRLSDFGKKIYYVSTSKKGNKLISRTKILGTYTLGFDPNPPTIKPINFKKDQWLSKYRYLKLKIDDKLTGIKSYRASINGQWILMEYDYKKKTLIYDFNDNIATNTKNILKVIVTDNVGNSSTFETIFYRK